MEEAVLAFDSKLSRESSWAVTSPSLLAFQHITSEGLVLNYAVGADHVCSIFRPLSSSRLEKPQSMSFFEFTSSSLYFTARKNGQKTELFKTTCSGLVMPCLGKSKLTIRAKELLQHPILSRTHSLLSSDKLSNSLKLSLSRLIEYGPPVQVNCQTNFFIRCFQFDFLRANTQYYLPDTNRYFQVVSMRTQSIDGMAASSIRLCLKAGGLLPALKIIKQTQSQELVLRRGDECQVYPGLTLQFSPQRCERLVQQSRLRGVDSRLCGQQLWLRSSIRLFRAAPAQEYVPVESGQIMVNEGVLKWWRIRD